MDYRKRAFALRRYCKALRAVGMLAVLALVVAGCGTGSGANAGAGNEAPQYGGVLRVAQATPLTSLDPALGNSGEDHRILYTVFDRLIEYSPDDLLAKPGLATEWTFPDPQTLRLTLRDDVAFTDGTPFNAEAVKFNIERSKTMTGSTIKTDLSTVDSVVVKSEFEVDLKLSIPDSSLVLVLADRAGMMVSPTAVEKMGEDFAAKPVGSGAYTVSEYKTGDKLVLAKNAKYWKKGKPYLDGIEFIFMTDTQARVSALLSGDIQFINSVDPVDIDRIKNTEGMELAEDPSIRHTMFYLNLNKAPLDNLKIRQALMLATDRQEIVDSVYLGAGEIAYNPVVPPSQWAYAPSQKEPYKFNLKKAKALVKESGISGDQLKIQIVTTPTKNYQKFAQVVQSQWQKAGFDVEITIFDRSISHQKFNDEQVGNVSLSSWTGRPDPGLSFSLLLEPGSIFVMNDNPPSDLDALLDAGTAKTGQADRKAAYGKLSDLVTDQVLFMPLVYEAELSAFPAKVKGYTPNLMGKSLFENIWLDE